MTNIVTFAPHPESKIMQSRTGRKLYTKGLIYPVNSIDGSITKDAGVYTLDDMYDIMLYIKNRFPQGFKYKDGRIDWDETKQFNLKVNDPPPKKKARKPVEIPKKNEDDMDIDDFMDNAVNQQGIFE